MNRIKKLAVAVGSLFLFPGLAYGQDVQPEKAGVAMMRLQASLFTPSHNSVGSGSSLWTRLREDFRIGEVNSSLVRSHESKFVANSDYFNRTLNRSRPYMYHITNEVRKRNMPSEIALLPFIESAYVTKARSHVGASGLWQFMPATGRHYGLEQTPMYDGRHDVYAATNAALDYLQYLHGLFGDWSLALAAYNWGEGNVSRAVRRAQSAGLEPTYENLRMPSETRNYVPKLLAVRNLVNNPQAFGLRLPDMEHKPYFATVKVDKPLDIMAAAHLANITEAEFLALNPAFKTPVFLPKTSRKMLLPVNAVKTFESNYRNSDANTLLSWDVFTPDARMDLSTIALHTGSSVGDLKRLNGITGSYVNAGRTLLINKNTALALNRSLEAAQVQLARTDIDTVPDTFVEQAPVLGPNAPTALVLATAPAAAVVKTAAADVTEPATLNIAKTAEQQSIEKAQTASANTVTVAIKQPETAPKALTAEVKQPEKTTVALVSPDVSATAVSASTAPLTAVAQTANEAAAPFSTLAADSTVSTLAAVDAEPAVVDPLMQVVGESRQRMQMAADAVQRSLAESNAAEERANQKLAQAKAKEEAKAKAQAEQLAKAKAQAEQLAKAKSEKATATKRTTQTAKAEPSRKTATHKVGSGDTLYSIAKRYDVNVADLIAANSIKGNNIRPGQVLKVAGVGGSKMVASKSSAGKKTEKKAVIPASHTVRKGDTLEEIANRYNLKVAELKKLNKGSKVLKPGQKIKLSPS